MKQFHRVCSPGIFSFMFFFLIALRCPPVTFAAPFRLCSKISMLKFSLRELLAAFFATLTFDVLVSTKGKIPQEPSKFVVPEVSVAKLRKQNMLRESINCFLLFSRSLTFCDPTVNLLINKCSPSKSFINQ